MGGAGSAAPGVNEIHNGADDNGSGTTVLVEVARQLAARDKKLPRRLVFIAFTGEERGADRQCPLRAQSAVSARQDRGHAQHGHGRPAAGRKADRPRHRHGHRVRRAGRPASARSMAFEITKKPGGFGPSDHSSFYATQDSGDALLHRQPQGLSPAQRRLRQDECRRHAARRPRWCAKSRSRWPRPPSGRTTRK